MGMFPVASKQECKLPCRSATLDLKAEQKEFPWKGQDVHCQSSSSKPEAHQYNGGCQGPNLVITQIIF